jgi:phenylalanyl-tRNA synthetase alpha chain
MITYESITSTDYILTPEGSEIASRGSHEAVLWAALPVKGEGEPLGIPELKVSGNTLRMMVIQSA